MPTFDGRCGLISNSVHVVQQLWPSHNVRRLIRGVNIAWACAFLWVCTDLLAHINAHIVQLVLEHRAVLQVLAQARLGDGDQRL